MIWIILYTLIILFIWWFFFIAKIHFYKFKNYSKSIVPITKIVALLLFVLSILWYAFAPSLLELNFSSNLPSFEKSSSSSSSSDNSWDDF